MVEGIWPENLGICLSENQRRGIPIAQKAGHKPHENTFLIKKKSTKTYIIKK